MRQSCADRMPSSPWVPRSGHRTTTARAVIASALLMSSFEAGYILGGKYQLVRPLGRGSMGEVWVAYHLSLGEEVAVKLLAATSSFSQWEDRTTASARFRFEAQIAARLSRKTRHIVRVTDHGEEERDGLDYLVMEFLEGQTLDRHLLLSGDMPPSGVCPLVTQIARALECAHAEHVVHRDLKPANILLAHDEEGGLLVKVLDFGIARATRTQRMAAPFSTSEGLVFGTPGYMSPEQAWALQLDGRADLWSLATVAYEALTGDLPLPGTSVQELHRNLLIGCFVPVHHRRPDLPDGLQAFFQRAFASRIEDRFSAASELALSFEQAIATVPRTRERPAPMPASGRPRGDTMPMAVDSTPGPASPSPARRTALPRLALAAPVAALLAFGAARALHTTAGAAASSTVSALSAPSRPAGGAAVAPEAAPFPELAPPSAPAPSPTLQGSARSVEVNRPVPPGPPEASPSAPKTAAAVQPPPSTPRAAVSSPTTRPPPVLSTVLRSPAPAPSKAPADRPPIDKSSTL
jgi:serine/threonine protein kinase